MTPQLSPLSPRQRQVFDLLDRGFLIKEIAGTLGISINTVKGHGKRIRIRLGNAPSARAAIHNFYRDQPR